MAESWNQAFGRYLKTLRERKGLSLQEVSSLSQAFTETLNKGYLSRCENGVQCPAFSKIIPLGRIYGVPVEVLLERLELDMELDNIGSPDTCGMSYDEMTQAGAVAINQGFAWKAYALVRDAIERAKTDDTAPRHRDQREQIACASMNCAMAARRLGRRRLALHEFKYIESRGTLGPRYRPIVLERLSMCYRQLNRMDLAQQYGDKAIAEAEASGALDRLAYVYSNRAGIALALSDPEQAAVFYQKSYDAFRDAGIEVECARAMNNLASVYIDLGRLGATRRLLIAAHKLAKRLNQHRAQALGRIMMGEVDLLENRNDLATKRWKEAVAIAEKLNDKTLRFQAEVCLYKQAHDQGDDEAARSLHRRLRKLALWVPADTQELATYKRLTAERKASMAGPLH